MGHVFETDRLVVRAVDRGARRRGAGVRHALTLGGRALARRAPRALEDPGRGAGDGPALACPGVGGRPPRRSGRCRPRHGEIVGTVLVVPLPGPDDRPTADVEIGWHLHPDSWGRGYATEAARAALRRELDAGAPEVFAVIREGNERSVAVAERLGMTPIGIQTRWYGGIPLQTYVAGGTHEGAGTG